MMKKTFFTLGPLLFCLLAASPNPCWNNAWNITAAQKADPCAAFEEMLPEYKKLADAHLAVIDQIVAVGKIEHALRHEYTSRRAEVKSRDAISTDTSYYFESHRTRDYAAADAKVIARNGQISAWEKQHDDLIVQLQKDAAFPVEKISYDLHTGEAYPSESQKYYFVESCGSGSTLEYGRYLDEDVVFKLTRIEPGIVIYKGELNPRCSYLSPGLSVQYSRADYFRAQCNRDIAAAAAAKQQSEAAAFQKRLRDKSGIPSTLQK